MSHNWNTTALTSEEQVFKVLAELKEKRWLSRGQSRRYDGLVPSIDRGMLRSLSRCEKLKLERQGIDLFRSTAKFFSHPGEKAALKDDFIALMVLRHYGIPTRLLDWSKSPYVAAFFSSCDHDTEDGEIWSFDEPLYEEVGKEQWVQWPETTSDGSGDPSKFDANLTAFAPEEPPDWFICVFYPAGFPRQHAQAGAYTATARFDRDHAKAIAKLLVNPSCYHLYKIEAALKPTLRRILHEKHDIWRGALSPDSAGAAETAGTVFSHLPNAGLSQS